MADHHPHASYQSYVLDSSAVALDADEVQISPPNSTGSDPASCPSANIYGTSHVSFPQTSDSAPYAHQHHPTYDQLSHALTLNPAHLRSGAVGPSRVLTRRQARMAQASAHAFAAGAHESPEQRQQHHFDEGFQLYNGHPSLSRPQTPNRFPAGPQYADHRVGLPDLSIGTLNMQHHSVAMSPAHPSTPASVTSSSGLSHYGFNNHPYASHSRSASNSTHPRSTSPAMSVVSAATSLSSGSGRPRPPLSSGSTNIATFHSTSKPKRRLANKQRKEICLYYLEHPTSRQEDIAARWGVERSTVSKILKHKHRWLAVLDGDDHRIAKHRPSKFPEIECFLQEWLEECLASKPNISDVMIRTKAREVAKDLGIGEDKFKASAGWVENFKHRQGIKKGVWTGRPQQPIYEDDSGDSDSELVSEWKARALRESTLLAAEAAAGINVSAGAADLDIVPSATLGDAKLDWPPPASLGMAFGDPSVGTLPGQNGNGVGLPQLPGLSDEQRQQIALDCQPPPPYPSDGVPSQGAGGALVAQGRIYSVQHQQLQNGQRWGVIARATCAGVGGNGNGSPEQGAQAVSAQEASVALDKVIRFLKTQRPDFLTQQEQNIITDIKHLIWLSSTEAAAAQAQAAGQAAADAGPVGPGAMPASAPTEAT